MKRTLLPALAAALLALPSCIEIEETTTLRADGSGTQKMTLAMTERSLQAARAQAAVANVGFDPDTIFDPRSVRREVAEAGLSCLGVTTRSERRHRVLEVEAGFAKLDELRRSPLNGSGAEWSLRPGPKPHTVAMTFYPRGRAAWEEAKKKAVELLGRPSSDREKAFFVRAKAQMTGLRIKWALNVPGDVLSHSDNVEKVGKRQISVTIDENEIKTAADLVQQLAPRFEVVFDARGCSLPVDE